jgi:ubiquinone/menaquinone biosynthesis C-methylase UbiE
MLQDYAKEGMTVIDIGCGMGFFSIGMAHLVGPKGRVHSVDLQPEMLEILMKRATRKGVSDRIQTHCCSSDNLGFTTDVDFILAFWMVHEVPDQVALFTQLRSIARTDCKMLIAEPKMHVTRGDLQTTTDFAKESGWEYVGESAVRLSHSAVFRSTGSTSS